MELVRRAGRHVVPRKKTQAPLHRRMWWETDVKIGLHHPPHARFIGGGDLGTAQASLPCDSLGGSTPKLRDGSWRSNGQVDLMISHQNEELDLFTT